MQIIGELISGALIIVGLALSVCLTYAAEREVKRKRAVLVATTMEKSLNVTAVPPGDPTTEWEITDQGPRRYYNHISVDENRKVPYCKCRPSNVLYWELSDADTTDCPVHHDVPASMARIVNQHLIEAFGKVPPKPPPPDRVWDC